MSRTKKDTYEQEALAVVKAFAAYIEAHGKRPASFSAFCKAQNLEPADVREHFRTVAALEKALWLHWMEETLSVLANSPEYKNYKAYERLLSFYYTWLDTVKPAREYLKKASVLPNLFSGIDWFLTDVHHAFLSYAHDIVSHAGDSGEIMKRPLLQNIYGKALWQQFLFILNFWIKDKSEQQTKTDEAIERVVNLFFELAGRNQLDSIIDFGKFLIKNK